MKSRDLGEPAEIRPFPARPAAVSGALCEEVMEEAGTAKQSR
jgi:hypothetical protein